MPQPDPPPATPATGPDRAPRADAVFAALDRGLRPALAALARVLPRPFARLARARHGAAIHAVGCVYDAVLEPTGPAATGVPELDAGRHEVVVRLSRALGLPAALPDATGLALRVTTAAGPQDVLLDSAGTGPLGRHLPRPLRDLRAADYGSLTALRVGGRRLHLGARPDPGPPVRRVDAAAGLTFTLLLAEPAGPWRAWGRLRLTVARPESPVRLTPTHAALGITPTPAWSGLRARTYRASRRASRDGSAG